MVSVWASNQVAAVGKVTKVIRKQLNCGRCDSVRCHQYVYTVYTCRKVEKL
jgi:hypothetical protein